MFPIPERRLALAMTCFIALCIALFWTAVHARDLDGRYAQQNSELHEWFEGLRSGKGPCCSDADGSAISDADWKVQHKKLRETPGPDGLQAVYSDYAVVIDGQWIDVEPDAVITEPNRVGKTMVWPIRGYLGISIRCFMPGALI